MLKKLNFHLIKIFFLSAIISQDFIPNNGDLLNYNQIFFKWPQINNINYYRISLIDTDGIQERYFTDINSIVIDNLSWNNQYSWDVCGYDGEDNLIDCHNQFNFSINSLPENYPININVLQSDESQYYTGVNLIDYESLGFSVVLDINGYPIWFADKNNFNQNIWTTQFLSNGNIVGFGPGKGYEFDINSNIIFETSSDYGVHHHFYKTDKNSYFFLDAEIQNHPCPSECPDELPNIIPWQGDRFIEIDQDGHVLWEWNTFDYFPLTEYNPIWVESYINQWNFGGSPQFDWTHSNSVFFDDATESVYMSVRNLSRITAVDYNTKDIIWNLGDSDFMEEVFFDNDFNFSHQHSAQITNEGNLLFFDNGRDNLPELSRCLEIDFSDNLDNPQLIWEYILPDSMLTLSRGECDRLLNGNTLITAGRTGNIIEVNSDNEIIWHLNIKEPNNLPVSIYRSERIPNLYPNIFSFKINNLFGSYDEGYHVSYNDNDIEFYIYNQGWGNQTFVYQLLDSNENILNSYQIDIPGYNSELISIDEFDFLIENYILKIFPLNNQNNYQSIAFDNSFILGDINNDQTVNVQDIVLLIEIIINDGDYSYLGDINTDGGINILDIIELIIIIIGF
tara:strand:- start:13326 stop:15188 length:1863 start_codon:yes stop_codon:yes gene_type:complete